MKAINNILKTSFFQTPNILYAVPSHLECRRIQTPLLNSLIEEFAFEFGHEDTMRVVRRFVTKDAIQSGQKLYEEFSEEDEDPMMTLQKIIQNVWCEGEDGSSSGMEIEVLEESEDSFNFNVTKCGYAELYEDLGVGMEIGKVLSCDRDFPWCIGFHSDIFLSRTKTIMEGDDICDFRYKRK